MYRKSLFPIYSKSCGKALKLLYIAYGGNMKTRTCCFTGHRNLPPYALPHIRCRLSACMTTLIQQGVVYFGAGGALGFDTLAAQMVLGFQTQYPQIRLILVLPCADQTRKWSPENQERFQSILRRTDKIVVLAKQYEPGCMQRRNRYLVDHSGVCVCYLTKNAGGTFYTVQYAKKNGLTVLNCALP